MEDYYGSLTAKESAEREARARAPKGGAAPAESCRGFHHQPHTSAAAKRDFGYSSHGLDDVSYSGMLTYSRVASGDYQRSVPAQYLHNSEFQNASSMFESPPKSPLMGLSFNPGGVSSSLNRPDYPKPADTRADSSWSIINHEQLMPIGTECKKRIVKSPTPKTLEQALEHVDRVITKSNTCDDMNDHKMCPRPKNENSLMSESLYSLDFLAEGERMVSELCNITLESRQENKPNKCLQRNMMPEDNVPNKNPIDMFNYESLCPNLEVFVADTEVHSQIVKLAVEACTDAENIAIAHHNRPCFKNIHSICAKTRSNVQKPDSAVANLHSQGIPWVIKNFIFSFVRILDGWKGVKELLSEKHDTFSRIEKKYYSPNIRECFVQWQLVTRDMLGHIYKTFKGLDQGFTMEQKSFTHHYYATNPTAPRYQNQYKYQQPKTAAPSRMMCTTPVQQYGASHSLWPPNNTYNNNPTCPESSWPPCQGASCKKSPVGPSLNVPHMLQVGDGESNKQLFLNAKIPSAPSPIVREAKMRQSWTISNSHMCRNTDDKPPHFDNRELHFYSAEKHDAELNKMKLGQAYDTEVSNPQIKNVDIRSKMIPLSQVERNMHTAATPGYDLSAWFVHKNNSCGDTKEEFDLFQNFTQKDCDVRCNVGIAANVNFGTQTPDTEEFAESGLIQYIDPDTEEYRDWSTKVYMKPGSYKVPTKPPECGQSIFNTAFISPSDGLVCEPPNKLKIPFPAAPTVVPAIKNKIDICSYLQTNRSKMNFVYQSAKGGGILHVDGTMSTSSDQAWEAAKQSAPKLLDFIHDVPKSDTARLYNALGLSTIQNIFLDESTEKKINAISGNDDGVWLPNSKNQQMLSKQLSDIWNRTAEVQTELKPEAENSEMNKVANFIEPSASTDKPVECSKSLSGDKLETNSEDICKADSETMETSNLPGKAVSEAHHREHVKRVNIKPKNSAAGSWYYFKKRRSLTASMVKKFQNILNNMYKMDESALIKCDMDVKVAPRFYEVVKYPMCLNDISTKLNKASYNDVEQVVHDFRRIFYNLRLYLKSYPDSILKRKVNRMSAEFEKMYAEENQKTEQKPTKPLEKATDAKESDADSENGILGNIVKNNLDENSKHKNVQESEANCSDTTEANEGTNNTLKKEPKSS